MPSKRHVCFDRRAGLGLILGAAPMPVFPAIAIVLSGLALCRGRMIRAMPPGVACKALKHVGHGEPQGLRLLAIDVEEDQGLASLDFHVARIT
jgi:hypothetical protein